MCFLTEGREHHILRTLLVEYAPHCAGFHITDQICNIRIRIQSGDVAIPGVKSAAKRGGISE
ncbi:MAG: hypothetical protein DMG94_12865 [Acidobacteria bacterium]|nr:MAG: hypothetical protein DMG94_12865 [Acidobacteriota bacterium]